MISVDEALKKIMESVGPLEIVERSLSETIGMTLAESIIASIPLPPFDNSAMDGYAIRSEDVAQAKPESSIWLRVVGEVPAGTLFEKPIQSGEAVKIMTGAPVPMTTDAVVMLEEARIRDGQVEIRNPVPAGKHIRRKGEDVSAGMEVLKQGSIIRLQHLGLLASLGIKTVRVYRAPSVSIIATGSELAHVDETLSSGKIYDSNSLILRKLFGESGCSLKHLGTVADDAEQLKEIIQRSSGADLLVISGGVSIGKYDYVKEVLQELGMKTIFWRVAIKPGKPVLFGQLGSQWVFGLPGNPISCVVCFLIFVRSAIQKMMGIENPRLPIVQAILQKKISKQDGRRHYLTAILQEQEDRRIVTPTEKQGSGMLAALSEANAFLVIPEEKESLEAGEIVDVLQF